MNTAKIRYLLCGSGRPRSGQAIMCLVRFSKARGTDEVE